LSVRREDGRARSARPKSERAGRKNFLDSPAPLTYFQ
jgi:hypothetical protein